MNGYIIWPKGDMRLHTCRVYKTLQEASDAAQERADFHHRPYEVRAAYETPQRIITDGSGIVSASRPDNPVPIAIMKSHVKLAISFDEHETGTTKQSEDTNMKETNR